MPAALKAAAAPSWRSTMLITRSMIAPSALAASMAFMAEPPVVVTSSRMTTRLPARLSPGARPSTSLRAPCSLACLRTKNAGSGRPWAWLATLTAVASGTAPISSPPTSSAREPRSASSISLAISSAPSGCSIVGFMSK